MMTKIPAEQAANIAALDGCTAPVHHFVSIYERNNPRPVSGQCVFCGGTVSRSSRNWYLRGLAGGVKAPEAAASSLPWWLK